MTGVLSIFDDPTPSIKNSILSLKKDGSVLISGSFNPNPIDVILKYRDATTTDTTLKSKTGIQPKDGMLILWPAWVPHEVIENKSNRQRINIAWGLNFK